jgi:hypothetical protein
MTPWNAELICLGKLKVDKTKFPISQFTTKKKGKETELSPLGLT